MPADQMTRVDLDLIYPPFLVRFAALLAACNARGKRYVITEGHRTYARSNDLHKAYLAGGPRAAAGGKSGHNFGLAFDVVLDVDPLKPGVQLSKNPWGSEDYAVLIEEAPKVGLKCGADYKDFPHIEWPGFITADELAPLDLIFRRSTGSLLARLKKVWEHVDAYSPNLPVLA